MSSGEGVQLQAQGMWSAGQGDDKERFLADLRALRDTAALEFDELAARAHYPSDVLKEAESGPSLPTLPILAAYVRACDADVPEWEERWRRLGFEAGADPSLPVRPAGASPAAVAGARAGVSVAPPDAYDPDRIRAALRGNHGRSDHGVRDTVSRAAPGRGIPESAAAEPRVPESPASWSAGTSWDETRSWDAGVQPGTGWDPGVHWDGAAAEVGGTPANGNHHVIQPGDAPPGTADAETPDAARAEAIRRDPFSATWLQDEELTSPPDTESGWPDRAEAGLQPAAADSWFTPREKPDDEPWPAPAETPAGDQPEAGGRTTPVLAQATAASRTTAGPAVPPGPVVPPREPRSDRLYPVRLLVVIVVAALIGSILVLLLR